MHYRALGRTGWKVSEISFGAWAIGGSWGEVSDRDSLAGDVVDHFGRSPLGDADQRRGAGEDQRPYVGARRRGVERLAALIAIRLH